MKADPTPIRRPWSWRKTLLAAGTAVLVLTLLDTAEFMLNAWVRSGKLEFGFTISNTFSFYVIWALVAPGIIWYSDWVGQLETTAIRSSALHVLGVSVLVPATVQLWVMATLRTGPHTLGVQSQIRFPMLLSFGLLIGVGIYSGIVLLSHLGRVHRRLDAERAAALELRSKTAELKALATRSQLDALRAQLEPHFLFNALNAISSLSLAGDGARTSDAIARLSEFLRQTLDLGSRDLIPVSLEVGILEPYLELCRLRFGDQIRVRLSVAPECLQATVPPLVIQPLIENATRHGPRDSGHAVQIQVRIERVEEQLRITVTDTGQGFPESILAKGKLGLGLSNTRRRLDQLYGGGASLSLANVDRNAEPGAMVILQIPFRAAA